MELELCPLAVYRLTLHPELIHLALPYIQENKESFIKATRQYIPFLHEFAHQYSLWFLGYRNNYSKIKEIRESVKSFILELSFIAPELFTMKDREGLMPYQRFGKEISKITCPNAQQEAGSFYYAFFGSTSYYH